MAHFNVQEGKTMNRLEVLRQLLADQEFHGEPCPLLLSQLNEAEVLAKKFLEAIHAMREHLA